MSKLIKDSAIYGVGAVLTKALGFFLIPIYTRYFTVEEYGILALLNVISQLLTFVFLLGVSSAAMRFYFDYDQHEKDRRILYGNATILLLVLPALLAFIFGPAINLALKSYGSSVDFYPYVLLILIVSVFAPLQKLVLGLIRVQEHAKKYITYTVSFFLTQTTAIIVGVVFLDLGLSGQLLGQLFAGILYWLVALAILKRESNFQLKVSLMVKLLKYGFPLIPFFVFVWIQNASGRFMLEKYCSLRELGIFALAMQFSGLLNIFGNAFDNAALPHFYKTALKPDAHILLGDFATKYFAAFGLISLVTLICSKPMILVMTDPKFHGAILFVPLLIIAGWLNLTYKIFHWNFMERKKTGIITLISTCSTCVMVTLLFIFVRMQHMGITGVIYAMIMTELFKNIAGYFLSQEYHEIKYEYMKICALLLIVVVSGIFCVSFNNVSSQLSGTIYSILIFIVTVILASRVVGSDFWFGSIKRMLGIV